MRKIISLMVVFLILFSIPACIGKEKPEAVITSFCKAMQKFDLSGMAACTVEGSSDFESSLSTYDEFSTQLLEYLKSSASKIEFIIENSEITNETATVKVKFNYINASPIVSAAIGEYLQQAFAMAFSGADEDAMQQLFGTIFAEKIKLLSVSTTEATVDFECIKTEVGWKIKDVPNDALNVLTCNISSAFDSLNSSSEDDTSSEAVDQEEYVWHTVPFGEEVELATIKIRLTKVTETKEIKSTFSNATAKEGSKFVLITAEIENITKSPFTFNNDIQLYDDQGRCYTPYEDAYWYVDNSFSYAELAPNIKETGIMIYNVPDDSVGYYLAPGKSGTNDVYKLLTA